ncbi:MAG: peptide transporter, permease component [Pseudonocardiales bacterium]|nr:peptide transporter, permease component [Pseudonocardiales bacterium]
MGRYLARRLAAAVGVLWAAYTLAFAILYLLPGDPAEILAAGGENTDPDPAALEKLRAEYGLDRPIAEQYWDKLWAALHGNFGVSVTSGRPVTDVIKDAAPSTLLLTFGALAAAIIGGALLALIATYPRGAGLRQLLLSLPSLAVSAPTFWVGLILVQLLSFQWRLLPAIGNEGWKSLVMPVVTLAIPVSAVVAQVLAKSLLTELGSPYVEIAHAKGVSRTRIHLRHVARNAAIPTLTLVGVLTGELLAGTVVVETVFSRAGIGRVTAAAVERQDIPVVLGVVVFSAAIFVVVNLLIDLVYPLLDPRIAQNGARA